MKVKILIGLLFIVAIMSCKSVKIPNEFWGEREKEKFVLLREDSTKWYQPNLKVDMENINFEDEPMVYGVFPAQNYAFIEKDGFTGAGNVCDIKGIDFEDKKILYNSFFVRKNLFNKDYIGSKDNEVFFTIIVASDFVDLKKYTHASSTISSRNHPSYMGEGVFVMKKNKIDYLAFITGNRESYAIVNMRLFDLKYGNIILISPQKDGSLRSKQIKNTNTIASEEMKSYVENLLKEKAIISFFSDKNMGSRKQ
jgi:hypothetical protein